jgi:hypothetical protein
VKENELSLAEQINQLRLFTLFIASNLLVLNAQEDSIQFINDHPDLMAWLFVLSLSTSNMSSLYYFICLEENSKKFEFIQGATALMNIVSLCLAVQLAKDIIS